MAFPSHTVFGIREVCHCSFEPYDATSNLPSFVIDTAKMSSFESSSTVVYAQGGTGNPRLMAWEGEKTMTFTIEDALLTPESFTALTGATKTDNTFTIKATSFAGYYKITAYTLVRTEDGNDHLATITIPRAKLQTQLNLSMAPSGDPASFSFTFDVFPARKTDDNPGVMFEMTIQDDNYTDDLNTETTKNNTNNVTTIWINGIKYQTTADNPELTVPAQTGGNSGQLVLTNYTADATPNLPIISAGEALTNLDTVYLEFGSTSKTHALTKGSITKWFIV